MFHVHIQLMLLFHQVVTLRHVGEPNANEVRMQGLEHKNAFLWVQ